MTRHSPTTPTLPAVSVLVRSYHRREHMLTLVEALLRQDHPCFEVIVVEQSEWSVEERAPLDALAERDPRLRVLYRKPLGLGGCRNEGLRHARYGILLSFDDDDLPLGDQVISGHARNYLDPTVVAVTGRHVRSPDEECRYVRAVARHYCLRYNFFGYPHVFCRFDERIESVQWVHGTNGSIRTDVARRVQGAWGESLDFDEHPLCLPLQKLLKPGERLVFDPRMKLLRRNDVPGGANVRHAGPRRTFAGWLRYYHHLVIPNRRWRSLPIYAIFPLASAFSSLRWIWTDALGYERTSQKLAASAVTLGAWPAWYLAEITGHSVHPLNRRHAAG